MTETNQDSVGDDNVIIENRKNHDSRNVGSRNVIISSDVNGNAILKLGD